MVDWEEIYKYAKKKIEESDLRQLDITVRRFIEMFEDFGQKSRHILLKNPEHAYDTAL